MITQLRSQLLPLSKCPFGMVLVDDESLFLNALMDVIPTSVKLTAFIRPSEALKFMRESCDFIADDNFKLNQAINGTGRNFDRVESILNYWSSSCERFSYPRIAIVDYSMEPMNGLELLGKIPEWNGKRILFTGRVEEKDAIAAFNEDLIDMYLKKQDGNLGFIIRDVISATGSTPDPRRDQILRQTFSCKQISYFNDPAVVQFLNSFSKATWVEYIAIGSPFGILGYDADGNVSWLQFEDFESSAAMVDLIAESEDLNDSILIGKIRDEQVIANVELASSVSGILGIPRVVEAIPSFAIGTAGLRAALFKLPASLAITGEESYSAWTKRLLAVPREISIT